MVPGPDFWTTEFYYVHHEGTTLSVGNQFQESVTKEGQVTGKNIEDVVGVHEEPADELEAAATAGDGASNP
eukprot:3098522-Amphidinium_carterae.1